MTSPDDGPFPAQLWRGIGGLDLEDLLDELRTRASVARRSQERMSDLLDAVVAVSADLELAEVLTRIVASATSLVDARYGALGVLGSNGEHLVEFITRGVTDEVHAQIGDLPRGLGLLGLVIRDPRPQRFADIAAHPDFFGFPPHHPPMHTFLGVPLRVRDEVFGNLYMTDKHGGGEFTAEDEAVLVALAAAAGVAIDNARLYDLGRRRQQWIEAVGEVTQLLLEGEDERPATALMCEHARRLSGGRSVMLALSDEVGDLVVREVRGAEGEAAQGRRQPAHSREVLGEPEWATARRVRQPVLMLAPGLAVVPSAGLRADVCRITGVAPDSPLAVLPLSPVRGNLGVIVVAWDESAEAAPEESMAALTEYAQQAGLALLAARAHRDRARMVIVDDRDRIARDMHDHVIQRLFATGLSLQAAGKLAIHPLIQSRLDEAVDDLDAAIKEIRHAIFELHEPVVPLLPDEELLALVGSFTAGLGFDPEMVLEGSLAHLSGALRSDVLAVVREGLSNVTRHARATHARVEVSVGRLVAVTVSDDGVGLDPSQAASGLVNLGERAVAASGVFVVGPGEPTGTRLHWRAPVNPLDPGAPEPRVGRP